MKHKKVPVDHRPGGFTIVELLIVIVVIAILAAITIVTYSGVSGNANVASLKADLSQSANKLAAYRVDNSSWPSSTDIAGLKSSPGNSFNYLLNADNYCLSATNGAYTYHITNDNNVAISGNCPGAITDGSPIQTITSTNCPTAAAVRAVDARNNYTYWVQKLADGKCWMLTNLAYAGGGTNTYGDVKTLANGTGGSTTYTTASYYVVPSTANYTPEPTAPSTSTTGSGQYGYLYNWCGAMGGQPTAACASTATPAVDTTITVCPAGWRLPTGNNGEFGALNTAINGGSTTTDAGLRNTWLAQWSGGWNGSFYVTGATGYYWSSTLASSTNAYYLAFTSSFVGPDYGGVKSNGYAVRCIAN